MAPDDLPPKSTVYGYFSTWRDSGLFAGINYDTYSLRRTKVALVYKRTGDRRAYQLLLDHSKLESTVRYGVEFDDALILSEQTDL